VEAALEGVLVGGGERDGDGSNHPGSRFEIADVEVLQAREDKAIPLDDQAGNGRQIYFAEGQGSAHEAVALVVDGGVARGRGELQRDAQLADEGYGQGVDPAAGAVAAPQLRGPQGWQILERVVVRCGTGHACKLVGVVAHRRLRFTVHEPVRGAVSCARARRLRGITWK
jgi:hypothetical protein